MCDGSIYRPYTRMRLGHVFAYFVFLDGVWGVHPGGCNGADALQESALEWDIAVQLRPE